MRTDGYYHAIGGEQYITIGNFSTDVNTDTSYIQHGSYNGSYYLIDDVSLIKQLHYSLASNEKAEIFIYDLSGKELSESDIPSNSSLLNINSNLENGIYFYRIIMNNVVVKNDKLIIIK